MKTFTARSPLISVIIPTYNYAHFLPKAIDSALNQDYPNVEVIVVDDGSEDDTVSVIEEDERVHYFYQKNKGLAAARNAGIEKSKGDYLVFLDADDWLEKDALSKNFSVMQSHPLAAFVSGNYYLFRAVTNTIEPVSVSITGHHYKELLRSNYIGMHAAVMFRRWVFAELRYDETLPSCEDYDVYLKIARQHPVVHHSSFIATYYFHPGGLSHNHKVMMETIRTVLQKQAPFIQTEDEKEAYAEGLQQWKHYYELMEETR